MAAEYDFEIHDLLVVCGINEAATRTAIIQEGFTTPNQFSRITPEEVEAMVKNLRQPRGNQPGVWIGAVPTKNLKALVWWARDKKRRNQEIDIDEFDEAKLEECIIKLEVDNKDEDSKVDAPGQLKVADDWVKWELALYNYLMSITGASGVPLAYVIRKEIEDIGDYTFENDVERLIHEAPLEGPIFNADNHQVYRIIKSKLVGTDSWEWISQYDRTENGRATMNTLRTHYDGPGEITKRVARAEAQIQALHYKSEQSFSFERFITKLNGAYQVLQEHKEGLTERKKVSLMCDKIQNNNPALVAAVQIVRHAPDLSIDFRSAANKLSEAISSIFPSQDKPQTDRYKRKMSSVGSDRGGGRTAGGGRFGGRNGRGRGRAGGQGRGGRHNRTTGGDSAICNGVDISNLERNFTPDEWRQLPNLVRDSIRSARARKKSRNDQNPPRGVSGVATNDLIVPENNNGTQPNNNPPGVNQQNNAGRGFGRNAYQNRGGNQEQQS